MVRLHNDPAVDKPEFKIPIFPCCDQEDTMVIESHVSYRLGMAFYLAGRSSHLGIHILETPDRDKAIIAACA
jgi:hypothetical protein